MTQALEDLGAHIKSSMTSAIEDVSVAFGELTLLSRVGVAGFKSISGEDDQIGIVIESVGDNFIEPI